jgi:crotonobetainyl-CoA:carnitine CoA-transferase CaiB-like acyl-CoA transferase
MNPLAPRPPEGASDDGLLEGIVVVDFTRVLAGPYCTKLLADLGATVIKLERPGEGDEVRYSGFQLDPAHPDRSAYFARINAGKQSIAIDFANPAAREVVFDLVRRADVVVENFSPGVMAKYGFDEPALRAIKHDLVYCSISGFGQTGPLRSMQAYAHLINAFSGMMELERGDLLAPKAANLQAADVLAGGQAFGAISAALVRRFRTGRGAHLDLSMLECLICADDINFPALLNGGEAPRRPRIGMVVLPVGHQGQHVAMQLGNAPAMWERMTQVLGRPDLKDDPRFATSALRREHWGELVKVMAHWLEQFDSREAAVEKLAAGRVPGVPMLMPEEVIAHPHLQARGAFPEVDHPVRGKVRVTAAPFQVDGQPTVPRGPVPYTIGQHTDQVLKGFLAYDNARVQALAESGVLGMR